MISVLVLTCNEEVNLRACLESLAWSDDVVVLDSYSSDATVAIARAMGARVVQRRFDNWSAHQNWAVENIDFQHRWVYYSDADERVTPELAREMQSVAADTREEVAYRVRYRNIFMGRWIKRSSRYPMWVLRFFRPECVRWQRRVNPVPVVNGKVGRLEAHFDHYTFNKGLTEWFRKHNLYSQEEANELSKTIHQGIAWRKLLATDPSVRCRVLKELAFHLPFRPFLVFCYLYFFRLGFLDGRPGLTFCRLRCTYEYMIDLKVRERRRRAKGLPV
jgi:glycosyltransferase involved in cell wall biosynthesis